MPRASGKGLPRDARVLQLGAKGTDQRPESSSLRRGAAALGEPGYYLQLKGASNRLVIADVVVHVAGVAAQRQGNPSLPGHLLRLGARKTFHSPEDPIGPSWLPFLLTAKTRGGGMVARTKASWLPRAAQAATHLHPEQKEKLKPQATLH